MKPGWGLLSLAVHGRNRGMTRLLSTYGAKPKVSDLKRHRDRYGDDMLGEDVEFLKQCGLNLHREMRALERGDECVAWRNASFESWKSPNDSNRGVAVVSQVAPREYQSGE